jgi:hypothetical protein
MTKNEIKAIQVLPAEYVADGTVVCSISDFVVALNPAFLPIKWHASTNEWTKITWETLPRPLDGGVNLGSSPLN